MRLRTLIFASAPALLAPTVLSVRPAIAQDEPPRPEDKRADVSALFERGLDLLRQKRYESSIKVFEQCITLFPDDPVSYYNVACAYSNMKDAKRAVEWLKKSFDK